MIDVDSSIKSSELKPKHKKLIANSYKLGLKLMSLEIKVLAIQLARTGTLYLFGPGYRIRIANHESRINSRIMTLHLDMGCMLADDFDEHSDQYAKEITDSINEYIENRRYL